MPKVIDNIVFERTIEPENKNEYMPNNELEKETIYAVHSNAINNINSLSEKLKEKELLSINEIDNIMASSGYYSEINDIIDKEVIESGYLTYTNTETQETEVIVEFNIIYPADLREEDINSTIVTVSDVKSYDDFHNINNTRNIETTNDVEKSTNELDRRELIKKQVDKINAQNKETKAVLNHNIKKSQEVR